MGVSVFGHFCPKTDTSFSFNHKKKPLNLLSFRNLLSLYLSYKKMSVHGTDTGFFQFGQSFAFAEGA